ncbi:DUF1499 domain-containing protein [Litorivita pollutaquae]|uniref:DUF1499 domain-containing protein n=1 Tax=Litorivita pollutaquae TaxID=2200892 RepID=A0A2V4NWE2_9RHOB|nr:DUF1499 domain-containing protein [Litorivita pollutaquae]PYC49436.1 DUF1499 domain-containing protein [Litorivita pollutaquae]
MLYIIVIVALIAIGFAVYVRLAPSDAARWHQMPEGAERQDFDGGCIRIGTTGPQGISLLDRIIMSGPRTQVLAGSVEDGMVTYIIRSKLWGFPDYVTVRQLGDTLQIYSRLRFGKSDMGVNKTRVDGWLSVLARQ